MFEGKSKALARMKTDKTNLSSRFLIRFHPFSSELEDFGGCGVITDVLFGTGFGEEARSYGHRDCGEAWSPAACAASGARGAGTPYPGVVARVGEIVDRIGQCAVITGGSRAPGRYAACRRT
jgi:hypothetical protein